MRQLVIRMVILASLGGALAATPAAPLWAQAGGPSATGTPVAMRACSLLPQVEVKRIAAPNDPFFDKIPPREESLLGGGSACAYSGINIQVNPFTPARLEQLRKEKGAAVPDIGDAAYLFDNH